MHYSMSYGEMYYANCKRLAASNAVAAGAPQAKKSTPAKDSSSSAPSDKHSAKKVVPAAAKDANASYGAKIPTLDAILAQAAAEVRATAQALPYSTSAERVLSETMTKYGKNIEERSDLGKALVDTGEAYRQLAHIKDQLEDMLKKNFIDLFTNLRKNVLKDVEQVALLSALVEAQLAYHRLSAQVFERLHQQLKRRSPAAPDSTCSGVPGTNAAFEPPPAYSSATGAAPAVNGVGWHPQQAGALPQKAAESTPAAKALFDYVARNDTELGFKEGALIELVSQIDKNWYGGRCNGRAGLFPVSYVEVVVPLKNASNKPVLENHTPQARLPALDGSGSSGPGTNAALQQQASALRQEAAESRPTAKALFDYEARNDKQLCFKEGALIELVSQISENWYEGRCNGRAGLIPASYVKVVVPLTQMIRGACRHPILIE